MNHDNTFTFGIRRLVLVDSAGFCYVEIPVNQHGLILGPGNLGKSSLLNSLRLFLLPENNFKNSRRKFAFRNASAGSFYSNEESYQHYFPSQFSFLIMEVANPCGLHCQILYRDNSSQLSYGRAFVPLGYDDLRPLFWDINDPDGIGRAVPELSLSRLSDALKKISRETCFVNDPVKLKQMLYSSQLMNADALRYSVLPLGENDERQIQSLHTLILLLFEMKADDAAMANAVASIIEADKKFSDDAFDFPIDEFLHRHEQLKQQAAHYNVVEKERKRFERLSETFQSYQAQLNSQQQFAAFRNTLASALKEIASQRRTAAELFHDHHQTQNHFQKTLKELEHEQTALATRIKSADSRIKRAEQDQRDGELLLSRYAQMPAHEIETLLREELADKQDYLNALKSAAQAEQRLKSIELKKKTLVQQLAKLKQRESQQQWQLQNQLDEAVCAPLRAVDPRLVMASPGAALDAKTKQILEAFTGLFVRNRQGFDWFDTEFSEQPLKQENFAEQYRHLEDELYALEQQQLELSTLDDKQQDRPQLIARTEKEIRALEKDRDILLRYPAAETSLKDAGEEKLYAETALAKQLDRIKLEYIRLEEIQQKVAKARLEKERMEERERELVDLNKRLNTLELRYPQLKTISSEHSLPTNQINMDVFDSMQFQIEALDDLKRTMLEQVRQFAHLGIYEDVQGELQADSPSVSVLAGAVRQLSDLFADMKERWRVHQEQIVIHNETVASYRQALKSNHEHIIRFQAQLNRELEGVQINDLVEIKVDIHTDPKFSNLVEEASNIDPYGKQLLSDAFYDRLRVFVADFFGESANSKRLTMDKVITGISYRTRKADASSLDRKGQSTSTTALINLELVYRLLKRVLYPGVSLSFPMVLDELASIDISQMPSLLERLSKQGFNLFSAGTHSTSSEMIYLIGRHLEVGQMRTSQAYSPQRRLVFWGGAEGFTDGQSVNQWVDQVQHQLLEPLDE